MLIHPVGTSTFSVAGGTSCDSTSVTQSRNAFQKKICKGSVASVSNNVGGSEIAADYSVTVDHSNVF